MKLSIHAALSFLFLTFSVVLLISFMNFYHSIQSVNTIHYATVHKLENSDFSPYVISECEKNSKYAIKIIDRTVQEEARMYEVTTSAVLKIPMLGYQTTYVKESIAR